MTTVILHVGELLRRILLRIAEANTHRFSGDEQRGAIVANIVGYLVTVLVLPFGLFYALHGTQDWPAVVTCNLLLALAGLMTPLFHVFGRIWAPLWIATTASVEITALGVIIGSQSGILLNLLCTPALTVLTLGPGRAGLATAMTLVITALVIAGTVLLDTLPVTAWDKGLISVQVLVISVATAAAIPFIAVLYATAATERANRARRDLLLAAMPETIVERLLHDRDRSLVESFDHSAVLFADIAGFVALSTGLGPERTIALLDDLYGQLDELTLRCGVEKVKTIGDAYLAVAGVPLPVAEPERAILSFACALQGVAARVGAANGAPFAVRIGIASGPVTAGVIGKARFTYDIWGFTVNLAARIEAQAEADEILVSDAVRQSAPAGFRFESAGQRRLKGIGDVTLWRVADASPGA